MSDIQTTPPSMSPGFHGLQIGHKEGRVVLGVDGKPFAAFYPEQAIILVSLILKHTAGVMTESSKAERIVDAAADDVYGKRGDTQIPPETPTG